MQGWFAELKRRNVLRAAAFYAAAGWLLVQIATQVFPFFEVPNGAVRAVVLAVALGFPFVLLFSWFYELTPEGLRRERDVDHSRPVARRAARRFDRLIIIALALAVLWLIADRLLPRRGTDAKQAEKSIAVLPFANLSDDKANAYFADGIQDEILTRLAKIGALKVISRTSTARYASSPENLKQIALQLGVANLLEGSVQKAGDRVHINVQLINAVTDAHLWAESYDRKLDDIFGVEGEVAGAIAEALNTRLSGAEQQAMSRAPTANPAAYRAYLRGRAIENTSYSFDHIREALTQYLQATQLDPQFALAWAEAANAMSFLYFNGEDAGRSTPEAMRAAADTALRLQPELGEANLAEGFYRYRVKRDFAGAMQAFEQAQQRLPNDVEVLIALFAVERRLGRWDDALAHMRRAEALDPGNIGTLVPLATELLSYLRRFDEAHDVLNRALQVSPGNAQVIAGQALLAQTEGKLDDSARWIAQLPVDPGDKLAAAARGGHLLYAHKFALAAEAFARGLPADERALSSAGVLNLLFAGFAEELAGDRAQARSAYQRVVHAIKPTAESEVPLKADGLSWALALAYAGLDEKDAALAQARRTVEADRDDAIALPSAEIALAAIQARFGERDAALAALPHLLEVPAGLTSAQLRLDPLWDRLRGDPRFEKLAARHPP